MKLKEILSIWIFTLYTGLLCVDCYGDISGKYTFDIDPNFFHYVEVVMATWFSTGVYNVVMTWIEKSKEKK